MARLFYAWVLILNRRDGEVAVLADGIPLEVQGSLPAQVTRFLSHALCGDRARALAELTPELDSAGKATELFPRFLAHGYVLAGEPGRAVHWLRIAVERGFINYPFLAQHDHLLDPLRQRDDFRDVLAIVHERWRAFPKPR
jgi:hypothetical protein